VKLHFISAKKTHALNWDENRQKILYQCFIYILLKCLAKRIAL